MPESKWLRLKMTCAMCACASSLVQALFAPVRLRFVPVVRMAKMTTHRAVGRVVDQAVDLVAAQVGPAGLEEMTTGVTTTPPAAVAAVPAVDLVVMTGARLVVAVIMARLVEVVAAAMVPAEFAADLPTNPDNLAVSLNLDVDYWVDNSEELTKRFNAWVAQK